MQRMLNVKAAFCALALSISPSLVLAQNDTDLASFVNLFIGTTNGGHVFPGKFQCYRILSAFPGSIDDNQAQHYRMAW
jgi:hypothetical protein